MLRQGAVRPCVPAQAEMHPRTAGQGGLCRAVLRYASVRRQNPDASGASHQAVEG
jgi:hypothetical protein